MPRYRVTIEGRAYDVEVPDPMERPVRAIVDGQVYEVHIQSDVPAHSVPAAPATRVEPTAVASPAVPAASLQPIAPLSAAPSPIAGRSTEISAPLPGTIVSINVSEGDVIEYGQELCVLEAMKMNNPIRATQAGQVTKIMVGVGKQVQHGETLMVVTEA